MRPLKLLMLFTFPIVFSFFLAAQRVLRVIGEFLFDLLLHLQIVSFQRQYQLKFQT